MRQHKLDSGTWLSPPLREALIKTVADTHQALLFLNRRGYAPLVLCRACGHRYQCPHCSSWLVIHKKRPRMQCHHCGYTANVPNLCSACGESDSLIPYGPGVERLAEEVASFLPEARVGILTSDNAVKFADMQSLLTRMESRDIDILIGTQMVAKGHHFPHLALVGVVDGDLGLAGGDLRAAERTYQLLHQVSGRAGREATSGKVLLQSYMPDHPVMKALLAGDRDGFMQLESEYREEAGMPPFGRLASVIIEGGEEKEVAAYCRQLVARAPQHREVEVLGPAPAPLTLLRGQYRYRLLIKTPKLFNLQKYMSEWLDLLPAPRSLKRKVDIDPYSFL